VGFPEGQKSMSDIRGRSVTGGSLPAQIWSKFMSSALGKTKEEDFKRPDGLKKVKICLETGQAATQYCPKAGTALFLTDMEVKPCAKHAVPEKVTVPDLVGMTKEAALALIGKLSLVAKVVEGDVPGVAAGTVSAQDPKPGSVVATQTPITITVSTGGTTNKPPTADFTVAPTAKVGQAVAVDGSASKDDGKITTWYWEFGDGLTASGPKASHTWATAGTYEITLWVTDDRGQQASATKKIKVQ